MFCDLVGSTALSARIDPEDLRDVVQAYQQACAAVIAAYDGYIGQYLGDGILVYFGYPRAHEDDAVRAVRAGLAIVDAVRRLNSAPPTLMMGGEPGTDEPVVLSVRVGIHTGLVVVGEMGAEGRRDLIAMGETTNVAARIQSVAEPDSVAISPTTHRLVQGFVRCASLGAHALKGIAQPMTVYSALGETDATGRLDAAPDFTPFVGRDQEVDLLVDRWRRAAGGAMQTVLLTGEAGIGKSRLVRVLRERMDAAGGGYLRIELRCSALHQHSALYPVIEHFQRVLRLADADAADVKTARLEQALRAAGLPLATALPVMCRLLSLPLPAGHADLPLAPERYRQLTLELTLAWLESEAARRPVLLVVEDLHWIDPSTSALVGLLLDHRPAVPMLMVLTCRPEFEPPWPVTEVAWVEVLELGRLDADQVSAVVAGVAGGRPLPAEVVAQIADRTDGVPLFVEELTRMVLETGIVAEADASGYAVLSPIAPLAIPTTLQDSLMARLDRLSPVKEIAQLGAVLGREFSHEVIAAVAGMDEGSLHAGLRRLIESGLIFERGTFPSVRYVFKHALVQDAAYQSLLRSRRVQIHARIARTIEARFPALTETEPEVIAHHFTEAGLMDQAARYWQRAGEHAIARSANLEAIAHFNQGLAAIARLPEGPERIGQELSARLMLGTATIAASGWSSAAVQHQFARARELCDLLGDTPALLPALGGMWVFHYVRGDLGLAQQIAEQCLHLARTVDDPGSRATANDAMGATALFRGDLALARRYFEDTRSLTAAKPDAAQRMDHGLDLLTGCLMILSWIMWFLGHPDQALHLAEEAVERAWAVGHSFSKATALYYRLAVHQMRGESATALEQARELLRFCAEQSIPFWFGHGQVQLGWALCEQGVDEEGQARQQEGLAVMRALGTNLGHSYMAVLVCEAHLQAGRAGEARATAEASLAAIEATDERFCEADIYRLRGLALLARGDEAGEHDLMHALAIARRQNARSLELRAATGLARFWAGQGRTQEARDLLAAVYTGFTEGFDTRDLREARTLLRELA